MSAETIISDCWNRIGVRGDHSCDKLQQHIHCRNCGVYSQAAQLNLQRAVGEGYQREWAEHFRQPPANDQEYDRSGMVFRIGDEWLALPTSIFVLVAPHALPHKLPHRNPRGLAGIVNVGGKLVPCVALADLLGIAGTQTTPRTGRHTFARLLLVQWEQQSYAIPVSDLYGIVRYAETSVQAPAATINKGLQRYLTGVIAHDGMMVGCLDAGLLGHQFARMLR